MRLCRIHPASVDVITILKLTFWPWRRIKLGVLASSPSFDSDMKWREKAGLLHRFPHVSVDASDSATSLLVGKAYF